MLSWLINIVGLVISWRLMDLESYSVFDGIICPFIFALFLISLITKVFFLVGGGRRGSNGGGFWGDGDDGGC